MKALHGVFPVPEMLHLCQDPSVIGQTFCMHSLVLCVCTCLYARSYCSHFFLLDIMQYVRGRILRDISLAEVHRDQRTAIYDAMNEALAKLHSACDHN